MQRSSHRGRRLEAATGLEPESATSRDLATRLPPRPIATAQRPPSGARNDRSHEWPATGSPGDGARTAIAAVPAAQRPGRSRSAAIIRGGIATDRLDTVATLLAVAIMPARSPAHVAGCTSSPGRVSRWTRFSTSSALRCEQAPATES